MTTEETPFEKKMRERKAQAGASVSAPQTSTQPVAGSAGSATAFEKDAPTGDEVGYGAISPEDEALDNAIEGLGIVDAYIKWCKKMTPKFGSNQRESIKCSCPNPRHPDKNPSAWMNRDKNTYYCSGCNEGGDIWDIAAFHFGFPVPGYKQDAVMFRQLREKIGIDLGFQTVQSITGTNILVAPATPEEEAAAAAPLALLPSAAAEQSEQEEDEAAAAAVPGIDWRSIVTDESFLKSYLDITCQDRCPEEYHFWNGLIALGLAAGRDVKLADHEPVVGNLFICLTGPTGAGKSRSTKHLERLVRLAIPYDYNNASSRGVKHVKSPNSAEYLVHSLQSSEEDPSDPKRKITYPVKALVEFGELSGLMNTANRLGNNLKPQLMEIYDANEVIESGSLTGGLRRAENAYGSVISTTQNRSLRKLLDSGDDGSGFINRWVFAQGKEKPQLSYGGAKIDLTQPGLKLNIVHQWAFGGKDITLSADGYALWDAFFQNTVSPTQKKASQQGTGVIGRVDLLMKKLMLLFAINRLESEVSAVSVQQAIDLWPYLLQSYGVISIEIRRTENSDLRDEVLDQIVRLTKANSKAPSKRELYSAVKRKVKDDKQLVDILLNLVRLGLIHEEPTPAGQRGRPTTRYAISE